MLLHVFVMRFHLVYNAIKCAFTSWKFENLYSQRGRNFNSIFWCLSYVNKKKSIIVQSTSHMTYSLYQLMLLVISFFSSFMPHTTSFQPINEKRDPLQTNGFYASNTSNTLHCTWSALTTAFYINLCATFQFRIASISSQKLKRVDEFSNNLLNNSI